MTNEPIRVAIIGTAKRSSYLYGPLVKALSDQVKLVAVWGRTEEKVQALAAELGVPGFTDLNRLVLETAPHIGIVSVNYGANGQVGLAAVEAGLNVLLETPIAHKLSEADAIIAAASQRGLKIEVAEQFHRRPLEAIKLKLIQSGLFGKVYASFNDFAGLLRDHKGAHFEAAHIYWTELYTGSRPTTWQGLGSMQSAGWTLHATGDALPPEANHENVRIVPIPPS